MLLLNHLFFMRSWWVCLNGRREEEKVMEGKGKMK